MKLESVLQYIDGYLGVDGHPDYPTALNGLQVGGPDEIRRIVTAVDASEASIAAAVTHGADLLIVHHGLFWGGLRPLTGPAYRKVAALVRGDLALYACHLPLDSHAEVGNSALLARALGLDLRGRFAAYKGADIGWWGVLDEPTNLGDLADRLGDTVTAPIHRIQGGPELAERVGVVTGGGASFLAEAVALGLDTFVTGEASHHHHFDAMELGINVLLGGHYATETFGVRALGEHLAERFELAVEFLDQPTGL